MSGKSANANNVL